ncbi:hypothetical protein CDL60_10330 [Roseateles noduli]|nr:hypothetical protein CDL60_10330 [Roseateles noduli]
MKRVIWTLILGAVVLGVMHWSGKHGNVVPNWAFLVILSPVIWMTIAEDDRDDFDRPLDGVFGGLALIVLLIGSVGALLVGLVGLGLRNGHGWEALLVYALPAGIAGLAFCVLSLMRSRD